MTNGTASETNVIPSEVALLPCPFCGGEAELYSTVPTHGGFWWCVCRDCGASTSFGSEAEAIVAWNARADDAASEMAQRIQSLELECVKLEALLRAHERGMRGAWSEYEKRDELIRDMARELRGLNDGGISTDCMEHERRMRRLGIEVDE